MSNTEVAEIPYTAFISKKGQAITARLIVRRIKDLNHQAAAGQDELFDVWRHHAVFTDSPFVTLQAEAQHRDQAIIEHACQRRRMGNEYGPTVGHLPGWKQERALAIYRAPVRAR